MQLDALATPFKLAAAAAVIPLRGHAARTLLKLWPPPGWEQGLPRPLPVSLDRAGADATR